MSFQAMTWAVVQPLPDPQSKLLLLMLANHAGNHESFPHTCWPSIKLLAYECSMSEDTVIRRLDFLKERGFVKVTARFSKEGRRTSNLYALQVREGTPAAGGGPPADSDPHPLQGATHDPPLGAVQTSNRNQSNERRELSSSERVVLDKELERVLKKSGTIRDTYSGHQAWRPEDKTEYRRCMERIKEIKALLGITY